MPCPPELPPKSKAYASRVMAEFEATVIFPVFTMVSLPSPPSIPLATVVAVVFTSESALPKIPTVVLSAAVEVEALTLILA